MKISTDATEFVRLIHLKKISTLFPLIFAGTILLSSCNKEPKPVQVSAQPQETSELLNIKTEPREGRFSLRSRIAYSNIQSLIETEIPPTHTVVNSRRLCRRIIGIKACGTANWNLNVIRQGDLTVSGDKKHITVQTPITFVGIVGVEGRVAKALGLTRLNVNGSLLADIQLGLQVNENWCPSVSVSITYDWIEKPTIVWRNSMDFSLEKIVNEALDKKLERLEPRINAAIDCSLFRKQLKQQWRNYSFAIDLPGIQGSDDIDKMHLNFTPTGFSFSGIHTEKDRLGLGFALDGTIVLEDIPAVISSLELPPLKHVEYQQSKSDFDILLRASYAQLENILQPKLLDKTYSSDSFAGKAAVTIKNIGLSSHSTGVTVSLSFVASLPGKRGDTTGTVFLLATPEVDTAKEELTLTNIRLTKVLDSTLWSLLSTVFESQIIKAIERGAKFNYAPRLQELEQKIIRQLQDTSRTGGAVVTTQQLSISLLDIIPETSSLAALARVSAEMDIDIPINLLHRTAR